MTSNSTLYISYAWQKNSSDIVSGLTKRFQDQGINYKRDKEQVAPREQITQFMDEIGSSEHALIVLSDKYLKSEFCMYELNKIYLNSSLKTDSFLKRTFFILAEDLDIHSAQDKQRYITYWQEKTEGLSPSSYSEISLRNIYNNYDNIISTISSLHINTTQPSDSELRELSIEIQKWLNKVNEPNLELIKRLLKAKYEDTKEIKSLNNKYPGSHLVSLLELGLLFRKGFEYMNQHKSSNAWITLNNMLRSRDELIYKTAFCFKLILYLEYYVKWKIIPPDRDMDYQLPIGQSDLIPEFLFGIELSNRSLSFVRDINNKF